MDPQFLKTKYTRLGSYIRVLGTLLHYSNKAIIDAANEKIGGEIISYLTKQYMDPIVITACCEYVHSVLTNKEVSEDIETTDFVVDRAQTLEKILSFLGGERYEEACRTLGLYGEGTYGERPVPMSKLNSPLFHKMIIAIVQLITLICERSLSSEGEKEDDDEEVTIHQKYAEYSEFLNRFNRETLLFNCLEVPSDDVKLAVAQCLDKIKISEIDTDETSHLVRVIGGQKNLGAGKTEEVLSLIFLILTKVIRQRETSTAREFIAKYSKIAIDDCMDVLMRDMARNLINQPDEQEEKVALAVCCIFFLKVISSDTTARAYLSGERALTCLKISVFCEERFMPNYPVPMDVECTWIGRKVDHLFQCMTGDDAIHPYSLLSFRLISRLADILSNKSEWEPPVLHNSDDAIRTLKENIEQSMENRIQDEIAVWETPLKNKSLEDDSSKPKKLPEKVHFEEQHETFSLHNGLDRLLIFLFGGENSRLGNIINKF